MHHVDVEVYVKRQKTVSGDSGLLASVYLVLALIIVPAFGLYEGLSYLESNRRSVALSIAGQELVKIRNDLLLNASEDKFISNAYTAFCTNSSTTQDLTARVAEFHEKISSRAQYAVFNDQGMLCADNFSRQSDDYPILQRSGPDLVKVLTGYESPARDQAVDRLRALIGPNFYASGFGHNAQAVSGIFYYTNFAADKFRVWMGRIEGRILLVRIPTTELKGKQGLKSLLEGVDRSRLSFAMIRSGRLNGSEIPIRQVRLASAGFSASPGKEFLELDNSLFTFVRTRANTTMLIRYRLPGSAFNPGRLALIVVMLCGFLAAILLRRWGADFRVDNLSMLTQIGLLLLISAGIPMLILAGVAVDYLLNKKSALTREKNQQMHEFVREIDQSLQGEFARYTRLVNQIVCDRSDQSFSSSYVQKILQKIHARFKNVYTGFHLVNADYDSAGAGKTGDAFKIVSTGREGELYESNNPESDNVLVLAQHHLAGLNSLPAPETSADRLFMIETFFQKPIYMVLHDLAQVEGSIEPAGWGSMNFLLFVESFRIFQPQLFDIFALIALDMNAFQDKYFETAMSAITRNPHGFKVFVARDRRLYGESVWDLLLRPDLHALFLRVTEYPLPEPEIITFQGQSQLFVGLQGNRAEKVRFCVLYPLAEIEKLIRQEALDMLYLAFLAAALIVLMITILYFNLLQPVDRLHQAALALENRDASFRLPQDGSDEFAEMAAIFNASMTEFEELRIASIVQTRLLPAKPLAVEGYSIYGHSLPMIELGGDYYDYFNVDNQHFALLLGDVAGHGVGASLIMAMAKAGVICGRALHKDPAALMLRLHQIVWGIKTRVQRKVMTFQYLLLNRESGQAVYANAGGCSPVIFDPVTRQTNEISHSGAVLGGFKKNVYSNLPLQIEPGQAMIFYTDGIVEARNDKGQELGYDGLFNLLADCYHIDAAEYYEKIMRTWRNWLGTARPGDDLTMIVLVRRQGDAGND